MYRLDIDSLQRLVPGGAHYNPALPYADTCRTQAQAVGKTQWVSGCLASNSATVVQGGDSGMLRADSERPSRPSSGEQHHAVAQLPSVILNSDMEAFGNRLSAIVNADFYAAALAAGPVDVPLGKPSLRCNPLLMFVFLYVHMMV